MTRVIVSGAIANKPRNGGNAWTRLNWALGLRELGFDVHLVEQIARRACLDHSGDAASFEESTGRAFFREVTEQFGFETDSALLCPDTGQLHGMSWAELLDLADDTDLLVNIGGHLTVASLRQRIAQSVYLDDDPGYTQFWAAAGQIGSRLHGHTAYYTYGANIGTAGCLIPSSGIDWRPIRPPVVLDRWPYSPGTFDRFTTIASWRGAYGPIEFGGVTYGLKVHEFRRFVDLPTLSDQQFEIALEIDPSERRDLDLLEGRGWRLVDPAEVAGGPAAYQRYVAGSGAEFSAAQGIYVQTQSGWFSDRSACYLASGKPALIQDTGFSSTLPTGQGLLAFSTLQEAVAGADHIAFDYQRHCHAARAVAAEYFASGAVIGPLLEDVGIAP